MIETSKDEALLLDLLNSTPVVDGNGVDLLTGADAAAWLRAHGGTGSGAELEQAKLARSALQDVVRKHAPTASLAPILAGISSIPSIGADGLAWTIDVPPARRLAVRAVLAWDKVMHTRPGRLRPCANDECALFLLDRSTANRGQWCSMAVCGNRMKARRHYDRARSAR